MVEGGQQRCPAAAEEGTVIQIVAPLVPLPLLVLPDTGIGSSRAAAAAVVVLAAIAAVPAHRMALTQHPQRQ